MNEGMKGKKRKNNDIMRLRLRLRLIGIGVGIGELIRYILGTVQYIHTSPQIPVTTAPPPQHDLLHRATSVSRVPVPGVLYIPVVVVYLQHYCMYVAYCIYSVYIPSPIPSPSPAQVKYVI